MNHAHKPFIGIIILALILLYSLVALISSQ